MRAFTTQFNADKDYYKSLGLKQSATSDDIKKQFYVLAKKHHPDAVGDCPISEEKFKNISAAYEILSNQNMRKQYDSARMNMHDGHYTRDPFKEGSGGGQGFGYRGQ